MSSTQIAGLAPLFRRAAEVIEKNGHVKGAFYEQVHQVHQDGADASDLLPPEQSPVCTIGALRVAAGYDPGNDHGLEAWEAVQFLAPRVYSNTTDIDPVERVADWNDAAERTPAEIIEALREAAAAAEAVAAA